MTAQSAPERDPDDPVEILRVLPGQYHELFLAEYDAVVTAARRPERYHELHQLLRLWRLRLDDLIQVACAAAGRTLTLDEVEYYLGGTRTAPCSTPSATRQ